MLKKKLIYLEILASLLLYGCSPSVKQTQAAAEKTTIEVETTAEAKEPEIPYIEAADSFAGGAEQRKIHTRSPQQNSWP